MNTEKRYTTLELLPEYANWHDFMLSIPDRFHKKEGTLIYKGRNQLRKFCHEGQEVVVKSFHRPNWINRFVYGILRPSKAHRSYHNGLLLKSLGIGTPQPIGYLNIRCFGLFDKSYLVTLASTCDHQFDYMLSAPEDYADVLREVADTTARLHDAGYWHKDYGRGNILFRKDSEGDVRVEIVDLNRMGHGRVDMEQGCKNFDRLPATPFMHQVMAEAYARARGFDPTVCCQLMQEARAKSRYQEPY